MYTILVCDDNTLYGSKKERIIKGSKCVDKLVFIVDPIYKGIDMTDASVVLEYVLPISREYKTEYLTLDDERYNDCFLQYKLPFDSHLTKEIGNIELKLTFVKVDLDANGKDIQRVRKTSSTTIEVTPIERWSDVVPDSALSALDQRIIAQTAQIKALSDLAEALNEKQVDNLVYNSKEDVLHLSAKGVRVGNKVSVKDMIEDGIPVIDLDSDDESNNNDKDCDCGCEHEDNVVEFDDYDLVEKLEDDNVVEF
jgi:hypothetical protein